MRRQRRPLSLDDMTTSLAKTERALLADALAAAGPDAPTLCEGWQTRHLAAHVVVREGTVVASAGIALKPLAGRHDAAVASTADKDYGQLVERFRSGPPAWSMFRIDKVDDAANSAEFFIHHEDVRRAVDGWEPRPLAAEHDAFLWNVVSKRGKLMFRGSPVGVTVATPDGRSAVVKEGPGVTLTGEAGELVMYAFGRTGHARVDITGEETVVAEFADTRLGI
jgi:uncharacterized protein (TIGR03085 family)